MINSPLKKTILEWQKKTRKDRGNPFSGKNGTIIYNQIIKSVEMKRKMS